MRRLLALAAALLLALPLTGCGAPEEAEVNLFAMDTYMTVVVYGDGAGDAAAQAASRINALEAAISRTAEGSDVSALNETGRADVSDLTADVLAQALLYSELTGGAFDVTVAPLVALWNITGDDPRVPAQEEIDALLPLVGSGHLRLNGSIAALDKGCAIDLGGIGKGYAGDLVAEALRARGVTRATLSLGGNVLVMGGRDDKTPWTVAIQDPVDSEGYAAFLSLFDAFVVTSGGYQRYFTGPDGTVYQHILDPKTGAPAQSDLTSVSVVAGNGAMADAFSTALYVMSEADAIAFWRSRQGGPYDFDMVLVTDDGRLLYTPGLADSITQPEGNGYDYQLLS